jgi:rSAM/selenodomain-associated transferase 2
MGTSVSIIIPALNEAEAIGRTLAATRESATASAARARNDPADAGLLPIELIVADGGSTDATAEIARSCGATVVSSPPGRARQMNAGARIARGECLLFLHADTRLPPGYRKEVRRVLGLPGVVAGAFALAIDGAGWRLRCVERAANLRSRLFELPYGDQGLFLRAELFRSLSGFPELPLMEDLEFARLLRRRGKIMTSPLAAATSARRWESLGVVRTALLNQFFLLAYLLGMPPRRIASWYYKQ